MQLRRFITILLAIFCVFVVEDLDAQRRNKYQRRKSKNRAISKYRGGRVASSRFKPYTFFGASVNALNYFGDLAPVNKAASTDISFTRPGFGLFLGRKFHHSMSYVVAFNYGRVKGDDITADPKSGADLPRYMRNASFRNDIKELSATLRIHILPNYGGPQSRLLVNGYVFFGAALFHHEPRGKVPDLEYQTDYPNGTPVPQAGDWVKLRELGTEGQNIGLGKKYSPFQLAVPVGLGGEMFVNRSLSVGLELGLRMLFFDHLDDVSGSYVDLNLFDDPLARVMSDRSLEPRGVWNGDKRDISLMGPVYMPDLGYWVSGQAGSGQSGYGEGENFKKSVRGNPADNDLYFMTRITVTYVLGGGRPKYR